MTNAPDVYIRSAGTYLPGPAIDNATLAQRLRMGGHWAQWVEMFVGTRGRHLAIDLDTGEVTHTLADMCRTASLTALHKAGIGPADVELVVMATATPDLLMPATVNVLADQLGINDVPTYQLQSGCTGAVQALLAAQQFLRAGGPRTALVVGGDIGTRFYDLSADLARMPSDEMIHYALFGDGAGAAVLGVEQSPGSLRILHVLNRLTGLNQPPGQTLDWFGPADRHIDRTAAREDYKAIEDAVPAMTGEIVDELLTAAGWRDGEVNFLLPPQLSGAMTTRIVGELKLPGAVEISCVADTGNTGNAAPFFQVHRALADMSTGQRALGISVESSKWIKAGFAVEKV